MLENEIKEVTEEEIENITGLVSSKLERISSKEAKFFVDVDTGGFGYIGMSFSMRKARCDYNVTNLDIGIDWEKWTKEEVTELIHALAGNSKNINSFKRTALGKKPITNMPVLKSVASSIFRMRALQCGIKEFAGQDSFSDIKLLKNDAKEFLEICNEIESKNNIDMEIESE